MVHESTSQAAALLDRANNAITGKVGERELNDLDKPISINKQKDLFEPVSEKLEKLSGGLQHLELSVKPLYDTLHRIEDTMNHHQRDEVGKLANTELQPLCEAIERVELVGSDSLRISKAVLEALLDVQEDLHQLHRKLPAMDSLTEATRSSATGGIRIFKEDMPPGDRSVASGLMTVAELECMERHGDVVDPKDVACEIPQTEPALDIFEINECLNEDEGDATYKNKSGIYALTQDDEGTEFVEVVRQLIVKQDMHEMEGSPKSRRLIRTLLRKLLRSALWWAKIREPQRSGCVHRIINSSWFETLSMGAIVVNCVFVAYGADYAMKNIGNSQPFFTGAMELGFVSFYLLELILKLIVHRWFFFVNAEMKWNLLDFLLVMTSFIDLFVFWIVHGGSDTASNDNVVFIRIFRILKLAKIFRAFRAMRFVKELVIIMESLKESLVALFWVFVMLTFMLCVFALVILQGMVEYLAEDASRVDTIEGESIIESFGSMTRSMLTLYMSVTGGDDWGKFYRIVEKAGIFYSGIFLFFTFFFIFALFNMLTGIFVEKTVSAATPDRADMALYERRKARRDAAEFKHVCKIMDKDGRGVVTWEKFRTYMRDETMAAYLGSIGLEIHDVEMFFHMVANSATDGEVSIDRFVNCCMVLKGGATAIDMQQTLFEVHGLAKQISEFAQYSMGQFQNLEQKVESSIRSRPRPPRRLESANTLAAL